MMMAHSRLARTRMRLTAIVVAGSFAAACGEEADAPIAAEALTEMEADAVSYGIEDHMTRNGVRSGLLRADTAYVFNDSSLVKLWGVDMTVYDDDGGERAHVVARRGRLDQRTDEMTAYGDVRVDMADGARIESPELHYDPTSDEIWSDSASVWVQPDGRETRGTCFRSDLQFRDIEICNPRGAAGVIRPGEGEGR